MSVKNFIELFFAMMGIKNVHRSLYRFLLVLASLWLYWYVTSLNSFFYATIYYIFSKIFHCFVLFSMLGPHGFNKKLIKKFGEKKGYTIYETIMSMAFFHNGSSSAVMCHFSFETTLLSFFLLYNHFFIALGIIFFIVGLGVKTWATISVGIDTYYYKDLFLQRKISSFKTHGPYAYIKSPMYGIGHLHGYGVALISLSSVGLLVMIINQIMIFSFFYIVEKPFIKKIYLTPIKI